MVALTTFADSYGAPAASAVASAWGAFKSPEGHTYYYNTITKESSWTVPSDYVPAQSAATAAAAANTVVRAGQVIKPGLEVVGAGSAQLTFEQLQDRERIREMSKESKRSSNDNDDGDDDDEDADAGAQPPPAKKAKKEEQQDGFFQQDEKSNCHMYVSGMPTESFDESMLCGYMKKAGIIAEDEGGQPKVKLYRNADGTLKGDGRVCFLKVESVSLALTILDGGEIAPGFPVSIVRATFEAKAGGMRKKKPKKKKQQKESQEKQHLSWHEDKGEVSKKAAGVVVIKNMFDPKQFDEDATYLTDIQSELRSECSNFGEVKKIMIFDRHPEGVISVKFADMISAQKCMLKMNNRNYNKRTLLAEMWDGRTNYKIEETDAERDARRAKWEADLEKD